MPQTLSEIVLAESLAGPDDVRKAAKCAEKTNVPLVVALVRDQGVDELALVSALSRRTRAVVVDPTTLEVDMDAIRKLSRGVCQRLRVLPLDWRVDGEIRWMSLAMADPTDTVAIAEVEHLAGCQVEPVIAHLSLVEELITAKYKQVVTEVMPRERQAFGTGLHVSTQPHDRPGRKTTPNPTGAPATVPHHRIVDEADLATRHEALIKLLLEKGVFTEDEYEEAVRTLLRQHASEA